MISISQLEQDDNYVVLVVLIVKEPTTNMIFQFLSHIIWVVTRFWLFLVTLQLECDTIF